MFISMDITNGTILITILTQMLIIYPITSLITIDSFTAAFAVFIFLAATSYQVALFVDRWIGLPATHTFCFARVVNM
jgi:hypothetical protein